VKTLLYKFVNEQEGYNKEFSKVSERLRQAKTKIFEEGKVGDYIPKDSNEMYTVEYLMNNKELALEIILPTVC
jgi:hypothetical protein